MKKTIIILGLALVAFANESFASNLNVSNKINVETIYNPTPLCNAIIKGDFETVKKFIEYGADVNQTSDGMTPLMLAARYNKVEIVKILLDKGARLDEKNERGYTALNYAEMSKSVDVLDFLKKV
ncbi:Ankyrin repeat-containing protein [Flavobacterium swingsii]|jgi:ankyrin repeat protein|uniref:Ankyrin repeat-containing protein n=1 Tax=Flavobacterium swingsii TaxID=498292 RepID=A0A1I0ZFW8_9FLAO|nr:ankyrin repeat domain-containing protein [Flavobacterium swingsii]SFB24287.1 Ankyrin repeat-containing protein [Flavobacterium swingsii]